MFYFARYYRLLKAIQSSGRTERSGDEVTKRHAPTLGEKTRGEQRWDPPYETKKPTLNTSQ